MSAQQLWSVWISPLAEKLSRDLILQFNIQSGYGLALYLEVERFFDNQQSVRIWTQRMLDHELKDESDPYPNLFRLFTQCLPAD